MRITEIDHSPTQVNDGLAGVRLSKLKRVVILAGANGSGKSRLLKRVDNAQRVSSGSFGIEWHPSDLSPIKVVPFSSAELGLTDPHSLPKTQWLAQAAEAGTPGFKGLSRSALAYIQKVQDENSALIDPEIHFSSEERQRAAESYSSLKQILNALLETDLGRDRNSRATLFGKPIAEAGLSEGQRALLLWGAGLHAQAGGLGEVILTMDEPENHLHPKALNETIERILKATGSAQIWIATHSLPLIAYLLRAHQNDVSLYFMDNGTAHEAIRAPEKVLHALMGGEENLDALREFIDLPGVLAANRFAAESLLPPDVIDRIRNDDPQAIIAEEVVRTRNPAGGAVRVLDFGAGHGRLLGCLHAMLGDEAKRHIDYYAWEKSPDHKNGCISIIENVYGPREDRWFNDLNRLISSQLCGTCDLVIMCGVLHEMTPSDWLDAFQEDGVIQQSLSETGELLVIEDHLMKKGEYAHDYGFLVLDNEALSKLFKTNVKTFHAAGRYKGRIKGHTIPKSAVKGVSRSSIKECLEEAVASAKREVKRLRTAKEESYTKGHEHAFWVQQFANASLASEDWPLHTELAQGVADKRDSYS